jgi:hypothetical protein
MSLTLAHADAALKEFYLPVVRKQLNDTNVIIAQLERNSKDVEGRRAVLSLHVSRNAGVGSRAEGGTLPTAGRQGYREERVPVKYHYGRIQINGPVIRAMKSDRGSFVRAVQSETKGVINDLRRQINRQCFNDANQAIAQCATSTTTTTINLTASTAVQRRQLEVGMLIDIGTVANPTAVASAREVLSVGSSTVVISGGNVTTAATDYIFLAGSAGHELTGLRQIVDSSGTLFNVNPATVPVWVSHVSANSGTPRTVTEVLLEQVIDEVDIVGGKAPNFAVASHGVVRNYVAQLQTTKRHTNTVDFKGGFKGVEIVMPQTTVGLVSDRDCPNNTLFFLNTEHLCIHEMSDWEFMQEDGAVLSRVSNQDAYEATLFWYAELTTDKRNAHAVVRDLSES